MLSHPIKEFAHLLGALGTLPVVPGPLSTTSSLQTWLVPTCLPRVAGSEVQAGCRPAPLSHHHRGGSTPGWAWGESAEQDCHVPRAAPRPGWMEGRPASWTRVCLADSSPGWPARPLRLLRGCYEACGVGHDGICSPGRKGTVARPASWPRGRAGLTQEAESHAPEGGVPGHLLPERAWPEAGFAPHVDVLSSDRS